MSDQTFGASYSRTINALIFVFPIVINSLQVAGDIILFILAMIGIFISISKNDRYLKKKKKKNITI